MITIVLLSMMMHHYLPNLLFLAALLASIQFIPAFVSCVSSARTQPFTATSEPADWSEEKNRLGSIPPSCYNKCNECRPCVTVQVPTLPTHDQPKVVQNRVFVQWDIGDQYANYKPLGWKCRCGSRLFNP